MSILDLNPPITPSAPPVQYGANLLPCGDCGTMVSRNAEDCPNCGKYFQRFNKVIEVHREGWARTIAAGVILAWLIPFIITIAFFVVLFVLGIGFSTLGRVR